MQDREAWLKVRNNGIGGTDASVIMGMSRFKTLHRLWAEKTGRFTPESLDDNEAVHFGALLEEVVADEFSLRTGKKVKRHGLLQSLEHPWMLASVDRLVVGEEAGLECKTASLMMHLADEAVEAVHLVQDDLTVAHEGFPVPGQAGTGAGPLEQFEAHIFLNALDDMTKLGL